MPISACCLRKVEMRLMIQHWLFLQELLHYVALYRNFLPDLSLLKVRLDQAVRLLKVSLFETLETLDRILALTLSKKISAKLFRLSCAIQALSLLCEGKGRRLGLWPINGRLGSWGFIIPNISRWIISFMWGLIIINRDGLKNQGLLELDTIYSPSCHIL